MPELKVKLDKKESVFRAIQKASANGTERELSAYIVEGLRSKIQEEQLREQLPEDATDEQIRQRARLVLIDRVSSGKITATEFEKFGEFFSLKSSDEKLQIVVESYENTIIDCWQCGANVHKPQYPQTGEE